MSEPDAGGSDHPVDEIVEHEVQGSISKGAYRAQTPEGHDQSTRRGVTLALLGLLLILILAAVGLLAAHRATAVETLDLVDRLYGPLVALTGTAIGFYFGGERGR